MTYLFTSVTHPGTILATQPPQPTPPPSTNLSQDVPGYLRCTFPTNPFAVTISFNITPKTNLPQDVRVHVHCYSMGNNFDASTSSNIAPRTNRSHNATFHLLCSSLENPLQRNYLIQHHTTNESSP